MAETQRKVGLSIGKRFSRADIERYKKRIEREYPDPVMRLAMDGTAKKSGSQQPDLDSAYEGADLIRPPFSMSIMTRLLDLDPYLAGAVDAIATSVSACDMEVKWIGDGTEKNKERKTLEYFFFESNDPTDPMSLNEKIKICTVDFIALGSWNLEIIETLDGKPVDLVHAPAEFVRVKRGFSGYLMIKNNEQAAFSLYGDPDRDTSQHQILRAINKKPGHRVYGKPLTYSLVNTVLINSLRDEKNLYWFDQGVLADLLVLTEETVDEAITKQIVADYQNTSDGSQTMYLMSGVGKAVVEQIKRELEGKSFTELEDHNRQRVLTALRVPPAKVAIYEDANRANTITQDEAFRMDVVKPLQDIFRVRFNHLIRHLFGFTGWTFAFKPLSLRDRKDEAEIDQTYSEIGVFNVNDIRTKLNLPPVEGGDRRVINTPLGLVDLNSWEIAVAAATGNPAAQERLIRMETVGLVQRLAQLREELASYGKRN